MTTLFSGITESGRAAKLETHGAGRYDGEYKLTLDGEELAQERVSRLRDGGTTIIEFRYAAPDRPNVVVTLPHRIGNPDRRPRVDGEIVTAK